MFLSFFTVSVARSLRRQHRRVRRALSSTVGGTTDACLVAYRARANPFYPAPPVGRPLEEKKRRDDVYGFVRGYDITVTRCHMQRVVWQGSPGVTLCMLVFVPRACLFVSCDLVYLLHNVGRLHTIEEVLVLILSVTR